HCTVYKHRSSNVVEEMEEEDDEENEDEEEDDGDAQDDDHDASNIAEQHSGEDKEKEEKKEAKHNDMPIISRPPQQGRRRLQHSDYSDGTDKNKVLINITGTAAAAAAPTATTANAASTIVPCGGADKGEKPRVVTAMDKSEKKDDSCYYF
ncbi:MAG: hypothetical protein ACRDL7_13965, partial [Gaiellaceae bacterium]